MEGNAVDRDPDDDGGEIPRREIKEIDPNKESAGI